MQQTTTTIRQWGHWIVISAVVISLAIWLLRRETLPWTVRIATAQEGGLYLQLGEAMQEPLAKRIGRQVQIDTSQGSKENVRRLLEHEAELAVVQAETLPAKGVSVVTPLFPELILVVVRNNSGIEQISQLANRNVALGSIGSGNRHSALQILNHYQIDPDQLGDNEQNFGQLLENPDLDAAIVTAGLGHTNLSKVLLTGEFKILPIADAPAIDMLHPFVQSCEVPRGLFSENPPVPSQQITSLSTTAYLVTRDDAPSSLVTASLAAVHEEGLRLQIPTLIPRHQALNRVPMRLHDVAKRYFNPADNIGYLAAVMESLAATKELLFAMGAGIYLLWLRWQGLKERETEEAINEQKEHLDIMLAETMRIEEAQMKSTDVNELRQWLDRVTMIKLSALHQFTDEELRGDQAFTIFLSQCASLINKLQLKIMTVESANHAREVNSKLADDSDSRDNLPA